MSGYRNKSRKEKKGKSRAKIEIQKEKMGNNKDT
jgi:hypothetical protein